MAHPTTSAVPHPETAEPETPDWHAMLAPYRLPSHWKSAWQLASTAALLVIFWIAALWSLEIGYWLTLILAVPAAMMVVRLFMLQHDCGHGSFFRSQKLNDLIGSVHRRRHAGALRLLAEDPRHPPRHLAATSTPRPSATSTPSPSGSTSAAPGTSGSCTGSTATRWCCCSSGPAGSSSSSTGCRSTSRGAGSASGPASSSPTWRSAWRWR